MQATRLHRLQHRFDDGQVVAMRGTLMQQHDAAGRQITGDPLDHLAGRAIDTVETTTPGGMEETSMSAILVGLGLMCTALMQLVAFGLGVAGALQADRRRVFAILGLVSSIGSMLGVVLLMIIGSLS